MILIQKLKPLHIFFHCHLFSDERWKLLDGLRLLDYIILTVNDKEFVQMFLYGSFNYSFVMNSIMLALAIKFLKSTKQFEKSLLLSIIEVYLNLFYIWNPLFRHYLYSFFITVFDFLNVFGSSFVVVLNLVFNFIFLFF